MIRTTVHRYTAPVLDRIPDFSAAPWRRQATVGVIASIVVHLLLFLFLAAMGWLMALRADVVEKAVTPEPPLEITVVPLPKEEPERLTLPDPAARELMLSKGLTKSDEKPENAQFESDQDMKAGSELPASGLLPLPSQEGRTDRDSLAFTEQDVIISLNTAPATRLDPQEERPAPQASEPPRAMYQPQPIRAEQTEPARETKLAAPRSTPPPRDAPVLKDDQIALGAPKPATPAPILEPLRPAPLPVARSPQQMAKLTTPPPQKDLDAYRERMEKARVEGSISNRGRPGVNAVGTPLGLYVKNVSTIVGSRWNFKVKEQMEWLTAGSVRVRFTVDRQGRVGNVEVLANNSNRNFADLCAQVIRDSKLDPIPPEVIEHLEQERLEIPFTFTLYPTH